MQESVAPESTSSRAPAIVKWSAIISIIGAIAVILSGYGYQWGLWGLSTGFRILIPGGTGLAVIGGLVSFIVYLRMRSKVEVKMGLALTGLFIALLAAGNFGYWYGEVQEGYPPIHDITTDIQNPPEFVEIVPLREGAPNPAEYSGPETGQIQRNFYDDLNTLELGISYDRAFDLALEAAQNMPWTLVDHSREEGRIEAYHTLPWFGFIDDVVIRIENTGDGAAIDVRSKSRVGRGDLGVNAKRIEDYLEEVEDLAGD